MSRLYRRPDKPGGVYYLYYTGLGGLTKGECLHTKDKDEAFLKQKQKDAQLAASRLERKREKQRQKEAAKFRADFLAKSTDARVSLIEEWAKQAQDNQWARHDQQVEEIRQRQQEEQERERQKELDETDPTLDAFFAIFEAWIKDGNGTAHTLRTYKTAWKKLKTYTGAERLSDITPALMQIVRKEMIRAGLTEAGVFQYMINLRGMMKAAMRLGYYKGENPVQTGPKPKRNKRKKFLSEEQITRVLQEAEKLDTTTFLLIAVAVHTGMRKGEVVNLRWEDFEFDAVNDKGQPGPVVHVSIKQAGEEDIEAWCPKSKQERTIPLKAELVRLLQPYREEKGYLINKGLFPKPIRADYLPPKEFKQVQDNTGISFTCHTLRHTFASQASIKGVPIFKVKEWLGHSTVEITASTYAHLNAHDADIDRF